MTDHLARQQLERIAAEDRTARIRPAMRVHVAGCDQCKTRLRALLVAKSSFLSTYPAAEFARDTLVIAGRFAPVREPRDWTRELRVAGWVGLVAFFAGAFLWYGHEAAANWVRVQGGASFKVVATHDGQERRLRDGDALRAGDRLAFEYSLDRPRHLLLFAIDDTGSIRRYYPALESSLADTLLAATERTALPVAVELDSRGGAERLYALFSEAPIAESAARAAISRATEAAWTLGQHLETTTSLGLSVQSISVWFRKD